MDDSTAIATNSDTFLFRERTGKIRTDRVVYCSFKGKTNKVLWHNSIIEIPQNGINDWKCAYFVIRLNCSPSYESTRRSAETVSRESCMDMGAIFLFKSEEEGMRKERTGKTGIR